MEYTGNVYAYGGDASFNAEKVRHIGSVHIQDKQTLADFLRLTAGARLDTYNDFGSSFNPRASAVADGPLHSTFRASYATAFRAPSFLELYDRNNPVDFGNGSLKAEKIQTIEASYTQPSEYVSGTITYYHNTITNAIMLGDPVIDPNNPANARSWFNSPEAQKSHGLELEMMAIPVAGLSLRGTFSHLFDVGDIPMPENFASFIVNCRVGPVNVNINGIYRAKIAQLPEQNDYVILNSNVLVQVERHIKLQAAGFNLFNTQYHTYSPVIPVPNRGVSALVGVIGSL